MGTAPESSEAHEVCTSSVFSPSAGFQVHEGPEESVLSNAEDFKSSKRSPTGAPVLAHVPTIEVSQDLAMSSLVAEPMQPPARGQSPNCIAPTESKESDAEIVSGATSDVLA